MSSDRMHPLTVQNGTEPELGGIGGRFGKAEECGRESVGLAREHQGSGRHVSSTDKVL